MPTAQKAVFDLELNAGELKAAALDAKKHLEDLGKEIVDGTKELAAMQKAMKNLQGGAVVNVAQFQRLKASIDAQKNAISEAQRRYIAFGGDLQNVGKKARGVGSNFKDLVKSAQAMPGPLGQGAAAVSRLVEALGGARVVLLAAGIVALTAATIVATSRLYDYALASAEARREENLRLETLVRMPNYFHRSTQSAKELQSNLDNLSGSLSVPREELARYQAELYTAGVRGKNLTKAVEGIGYAAAGGASQVELFKYWAVGMARTGGEIDKLTQKYKNRFGGVVRAQLLSTEVQQRKLRESASTMFSGLNIDKLLEGKKAVNDLFSQSTESGKALKLLFETLLQPLIDVATSAQLVLKRFFQGAILGFYDVLSAVLDVFIAVDKTFGGVGIKKLNDFTSAVDVGRAAVWLFFGAVAAAVVKTSIWIAQLAIAGVSAIVSFAKSLTVTAVTAVWEFVAALSVGAVGALRAFVTYITTTSVAAIGTFASELIITAIAALWEFALITVPAAVTAVGAFVVSIGTSAIAAVGSFAAAMIPLALEFLSIGSVVALAVAALWGLYKIFELLYVIITEPDWSGIGKAIITGIIDGMMSAGAALQKAFSSIKDLCVDTFKDLFGIHSPSKVFEELGLNLSEGLSVGIEKGSADVDAEVAHVISDKGLDVPKSQPANLGALSAASAASNASGVSISIGDIVVNVEGGDPAKSQELGKQVANAAKSMLLDELRKVGFELGAVGVGT